MDHRSLNKETPETTTDERRQWARFLSSVGEIVVRPQGGQERKATVVDESFGGIGLVAEDASGLAPETVVDVTYEGAKMLATVKYICPTDDGRFRVGMQWQTRVDDQGSLQDRLEQFESRLFTLFHLLEIGDWDELQKAAEHLEADSARIEAPKMGQAAANLRNALEVGATKKDITMLLERLVDACTDAAT